VKMLVILTAQLAGSTASFKSTATINPGATRTQVYEWALGQTGLDRLRESEYAVTFFYAEPGEVAA
jgi:hypothetical protein